MAGVRESKRNDSVLPESVSPESGLVGAERAWRAAGLPADALVALDDDRLAAAIVVDLRRAELRVQVLPGASGLAQALERGRAGLLVVDTPAWSALRATLPIERLEVLLAETFVVLLDTPGASSGGAGPLGGGGPAGDAAATGPTSLGAAGVMSVDMVSSVAQAEVLRACQLAMLWEYRAAAARSRTPAAPSARVLPLIAMAAAFVELDTGRRCEGFATQEASEELSLVISLARAQVARDAAGQPRSRAWRRLESVEHSVGVHHIYEVGGPGAGVPGPLFWAVVTRASASARMTHVAVCRSWQDVPALLRFAALRLVSPPALSLPPPSSVRPVSASGRER